MSGRIENRFLDNEEQLFGQFIQQLLVRDRQLHLDHYGPLCLDMPLQVFQSPL